MENSKTIHVSFKGKTAELRQLPNGKWVCTNIGEFTKLGSSVTWLDDCRVPTADTIPAVPQAKGGTGDIYGFKNGDGRNGEFYDNTRGRFPANLLVSDDVLNDYSRYFSVDEWSAKLPPRIQKTFPFFIVPKASKREKNEGLDDREAETVNDGRQKAIDNAFQRGKTERLNIHPTVKPLQLMCYLVTLGSRQGDTVLDPFLGSGTTAIAAKLLNRKYIGIEREKEYIEIAKARLDATPNTLF